METIEGSDPDGNGRKCMVVEAEEQRERKGVSSSRVGKAKQVKGDIRGKRNHIFSVGHGHICQRSEKKRTRIARGVNLRAKRD